MQKASVLFQVSFYILVTVSDRGFRREWFGSGPDPSAA